MMREMKDSGIEWIGMIPKKWRVIPFTKALLSIVDYRGKTPQKTDDGTFLVTAKNIKNGKIDYELSKEYVRTEDYDEIMHRGKLAIGDVLFTTEAPLGEVANVDRTDIALAQRVIKFSGKNDIIDNYFLKYWIFSSGFQNNLQSFATGSTAKGIKASKLGKLKTIIPPLLEQKKIVKFLDRKCAEIDALHSNIEQQIATLEEYKKSVITEAVTKGLNPAIEMKDSGIEYIPLIPAHWNTSKLKYLGKFQNGISKGGEFFGEGTPFVSYGDVYKNYSLPDRVNGLIRSTKSEQINYSVNLGDVFFTRTSETIEEIGFASTCLASIENAVFAGFVIRFRPDNFSKLNPEFSKYYFRSEIHRKFFVKEMNIVIRASLSQILLGSLPVLLPSIDEQKSIATYLDQKCSEIDALIEEKKGQLTVLEEYKKSLIYEYVTGKKEVM